MNILIIGSFGFIGSHCMTYFRSKKHDVTLADIISTNIPNYIQVSKSDTNFDILFEKKSYDICINASGSANVRFSFENPDVDFELNVINVHKILTSIKKHCPDCKLINFSSAAVYGNPTKLPVKENIAPSPISPYGFHKYQSEILLNEYFKIFGIRSCSLRVFSAYGSRLKKQLFWDLYCKSKKSNQISLFGTGNESRDFIHIMDLVRVIEIIINNDVFYGEPINVATGEETKIKTVVKEFFSILDDSITHHFNNQVFKGYPTNWQADIKKLASLGFSPQLTTKEGLKEYIGWLKENE